MWFLRGHGYESPHDAVVRNRLRAARIWTDEYFAIAKIFITGKKSPSIGSLDKMLDLRERLGCRPFSWFLNNIDPNHDIQSVDSLEYYGEIKSEHPAARRFCLDTMSHSQAGEAFDVFPCHGEGGTQHWVRIRDRDTIIPVANERLCLNPSLKFVVCKDVPNNKVQWDVQPVSANDENPLMLKFRASNRCLGVEVEGKVRVLDVG